MESSETRHLPNAVGNLEERRERVRDPRRSLMAAVGVVALAAVLAATAATWFFLHGGFEGGVPISARFSSPGAGQQLPIGGDVKVRGVLVGRIHDIRLVPDEGVSVDMRLNDSEDIPASSRAEIRSKTVFGQKWIELIPPADGRGPYFAAGDSIRDERTTEPLELERALQLGHDLLSAVPLDDLAAATRALATGFSGQEGDARTAIDRGLVALRAVNSRGDQLDLGLRQLREFSAWLDANDTSLLSFMDSFDQMNRALVGAAPSLRSNLQTVPAFFDRLASFQEMTEQDLGRLIQSGATVAEIVAARSDDLTDIVIGLESFTTVWNSGLKQPCSNIYESNLTCWQVYQPPGLDSRGLYGPGEAPDANEPGDPLRGVAGESPLGSTAIQDLLRSAAAQENVGLTGVLTAPLGGTP